MAEHPPKDQFPDLDVPFISKDVILYLNGGDEKVWLEFALIAVGEAVVYRCRELRNGGGPWNIPTPDQRSAFEADGGTIQHTPTPAYNDQNKPFTFRSASGSA